MSRLAGEIFGFLVLALLACALIFTRVRQRRNRELDAWVQSQAVIYDCAVLVRQCMHPECIHLVGRDETAEVELALSPLSNFGEVWAALRRAGIVAASSE